MTARLGRRIESHWYRFSNGISIESRHPIHCRNGTLRCSPRRLGFLRTRHGRRAACLGVRALRRERFMRLACWRSRISVCIGTEAGAITNRIHTFLLRDVLIEDVWHSNANSSLQISKIMSVRSSQSGNLAIWQSGGCRAGLRSGRISFDSIQRLPVALQGDCACYQHEHPDRPQVWPNLYHAVSLQHDAAHDAQEMRQRQHLANGLRP